MTPTTQTATMTQYMAGMEMSDAPPSSDGGGDTVIVGTDAGETLTGGSGADTIEGGYGDDRLIGGDGGDRLDGGRGSDLLIGGAGDDVLVSRSDAGEDRIGQIVTDQLSRQIDDEVDTEYLKLADWVDLALVGDDVLVGGSGADKFVFEALINAKEEIIKKHVNADGTIDWAGVAGENNELHDHWVDSIGIDVIADYEAGVDQISIKGHTTNIEVNHRAIDTDGDGLNDDIVSEILLYSQQGAGGGAHDEDLIGHVIVHDLVEAGDIETDAGVTYGIVETIDEIGEAIHPGGETKWTTLADGTMHLGYDTRDVVGDPIGSDPEAFSSNPWLDMVEMAKSVGDYEAPGIALRLDEVAGRQTVAHDATMALAEGTLAFSFTATAAEGQKQVLFEKAEGDEKLTAFINADGQLKVVMASGGTKRVLTGDDAIEAGVETHLSFAFSGDATTLFVDGEEVDAKGGLEGGLSDNDADIAIGSRADGNNGFSGQIGDVVLLDRPIDEAEALLLSSAEGDVDKMADVWGDGAEAAPSDEAAMATAEDRGSIFDRILDFLKSIFGIDGSGDAAGEAPAAMPMTGMEGMALHLHDVVPATRDLDDAMPDVDDTDADADDALALAA